MIRNWIFPGLVLGLALWLSAPLKACDIGADPYVTIEVSGGENLGEDCTLGIRHVVVNEGESISFRGAPSSQGSCDSQSLAEYVRSNGGSDKGFNLREIIMRSPNPVVAAGSFIFSFVAGGHPYPGKEFRYNARMNGSGVPPILGGTADTLDQLVTMKDQIDADGWEPSGAPEIQGFVEVQESDAFIEWKIRASDLEADYAAFNETSSMGYNPSTPQGQTDNSGMGASISRSFDTPTFVGQMPAPETAEAFYTVFAQGSIPWEFNDGGSGDASMSIPMTWCESGTAPDACDPNYEIRESTFEFTWSGTILHTGTPDKMRTNGEGRPFLVVVHVRDNTPPLSAYASRDPGGSDTDLDFGDRPGGQAPANARFYVTVIDNNPHATDAEFGVDAFYLVERSHWQQRTGPWAHDPGDPFGTDRYAVNPGHEFRWEMLTGGVVSTEALEVGGEPVGVKVVYGPFEVSEPTGVHYAAGVSGGGYAPYDPKGLKAGFQVHDLTHVGGSRPASPPPDVAALGDLTEWSEPQQGFRSGGGAVPEGPHDSTADPANLAANCSNCNGFSLAGVPNWGTTDEFPPSVVIWARDTKHDRAYLFGENFQSDAAGGDNVEYMTAFELGSGGSTTTENQEIMAFTHREEWNDNGADGGYSDLLSAYPTTFLPSASSIGAGGSGEYAGLWIDEDTYVEFDIFAWDNLNGWVDGDFGIASMELRLVDEPSEGSMDGPGTYLFRNPNRPSADHGSLGRAYVVGEATDLAGNHTRVEVEIYIADNQLQIYSLQESRQRLAND